WHVETLSLLPALQPELGELYALRALEEVPAERAFAGHVLQKELPLRLEGVVVAFIRHLLPAGEEVDRLRDVRIPHRLWCGFIALKKTLAQAGDGASLRAVDLEREQIVAPDAHVPGRIEVRHDAAGEPERRISGIVGCGLVLPAAFIPAIRDVGGAEAAHRLHFAEQVIEHVAPVAQHVEDDAAAVPLAVVPGGSLRRDTISLEDPVAKLPAHREDAAEEPLLLEFLQLQEPRQPQLVLHHAVLHAGLFRCGGYRLSAGERSRDWLHAVDVLARRDRAPDELWAKLRRRGVEEHRVVFAFQCAIQVGGPARDAVLSRERLHLRRVAPDKERIGHEPRTVLQGQPALPADLEDGADEVLVHAHAAGHAVHDDADAILAHVRR